MTLEVEIVRIPVTAARIAELIHALETAQAGYLAAPACQGLKLLVSEARDEVAAIVTWSSAQAHTAAARTPHAAAFLEAVSAIANGRPDIRSYLPAGEGK